MSQTRPTTKKSTTVALIGSMVLIMTAFSSTTLVEGAAKIPHKPDTSHPKGTSPWPPYGEIPETNTPEIKAWSKLVDWSKVPNLPIRKTKSRGEPPDCPKKDPPKGDCWWTCTGCFAPDDVMDCPGKKVWGLTFDDGPEPGVTENLLNLLDEKNVTATFFVTGMKSTKAPWLLQETIDRGHHLASHTWSHSGLTTMTNEEIVGELKWTEKYIFDHTGYKVKYFRPPYGDVDNRVRAIARELGFKTVIWSSDWDTQDWQLEEKTITPKQIVGIFNDGLSELPRLKRGIITLEHDSDIRMVPMARTLLTMGMKNGMKPMSIAQCTNDPIGYNAVPAPKVAAVVKPAAPRAPAKQENVEKTSAKSPGGIEESQESGEEKIVESTSKKESSASSLLFVNAGVSAACWSVAAVVVSFLL